MIDHTPSGKKNPCSLSTGCVESSTWGASGEFHNKPLKIRHRLPSFAPAPTCTIPELMLTRPRVLRGPPLTQLSCNVLRTVLDTCQVGMLAAAIFFKVQRTALWDFLIPAQSPMSSSTATNTRCDVCAITWHFLPDINGLFIGPSLHHKAISCVLTVTNFCESKQTYLLRVAGSPQQVSSRVPHYQLPCFLTSTRHASLRSSESQHAPSTCPLALSSSSPTPHLTPGACF